MHSDDEARKERVTILKDANEAYRMGEMSLDGWQNILNADFDNSEYVKSGIDKLTVALNFQDFGLTL